MQLDQQKQQHVWPRWQQFTSKEWGQLTRPIFWLTGAHKEAACQCNHTITTVNNDNKSNHHAHELIFSQLPHLPPLTNPSHLSQYGSNSFPLIPPTTFNCCQDHRKPCACHPQCASVHLGGAFVHVCAHVCVCESVCVGICWEELQQGRGSLVSQFSALIGVNERPFCCSAESPSHFFFEFTACRQNDTHTAWDVTSSQVWCFFTRQGYAPPLSTTGLTRF